MFVVLRYVMTCTLVILPISSWYILTSVALNLLKAESDAREEVVSMIVFAYIFAVVLDRNNVHIWFTKS